MGLAPAQWCARQRLVPAAAAAPEASCCCRPDAGRCCRAGQQGVVELAHALAHSSMLCRSPPAGVHAACSWHLHLCRQPCGKAHQQVAVVERPAAAAGRAAWQLACHVRHQPAASQAQEEHAAVISDGGNAAAVRAHCQTCHAALQCQQAGARVVCTVRSQLACWQPRSSHLVWPCGVKQQPAVITQPCQAYSTICIAQQQCAPLGVGAERQHRHACGCGAQPALRQHLVAPAAAGRVQA